MAGIPNKNETWQSVFCAVIYFLALLVLLLTR
jgi:hypothetical protein